MSVRLPLTNGDVQYAVFADDPNAEEVARWVPSFSGS
jgi:hypothetical protein